MRRSPCSLLLLLPALAAGCSRYEVTFNDQPVHKPAKTFTDYDIADPALRTCIAQTIRDQRVSHAGELKRLVCTNAGIGSLSGLETFVALEALNLAGNDLAEIKPALALPSLVRVDLSGNSGLVCADASALTERGVTTTVPPHCRQPTTAD